LIHTILLESVESRVTRPTYFLLCNLLWGSSHGTSHLPGNFETERLILSHSSLPSPLGELTSVHITFLKPESRNLPGPHFLSILLWESWPWCTQPSWKAQNREVYPAPRPLFSSFGDADLTQPIFLTTVESRVYLAHVSVPFALWGIDLGSPNLPGTRRIDKTYPAPRLFFFEISSGITLGQLTWYTQSSRKRRNRETSTDPCSLFIFLWES
jgi:hypothetical protein